MSKTVTRRLPRNSVNPTRSTFQNNKKTLTENQTTTTSPPAQVTSENDILYCLFGIRLGRRLGRKCCGGFKTYHPRFDTCCMRTAKHAVVHNGKPEKNHVCCPEYGNYDGDDDINKVYSRGSSEMPCLHPSLNDKFWQKPPKLKQMAKYCHSYKYAYTIRIRKLTSVTRTTPIKCYDATLKRWPLDNSSEKGNSSSKCIPIDKYSPKRKLSHKIFAVLTDHNYRDDLDFYLDQWTTEKEALVFKGPRKMKIFRKSFKKILQQCQERNSKTPNKTSKC